MGELARDPIPEIDGDWSRFQKERCGALKRDGALCTLEPTGVGGRCRMHGGLTPSGVFSPVATHLEKSRYAPSKRLMERYSLAANDPEMLSLREDIALLDARISDVLSRVDTGESGHLWKALKDAWTEAELSIDADPITQMRAMAKLGELIDRGLADTVAWGEITASLQQRRKLVESERKRMVETQQMITSTQALVMINQLSTAIMTHVSDPHARAAIATEFVRITGSAASPATS
jgi:hypothetical protein